MNEAGPLREYLPTGNDDGLHALVITQSCYGLKPDPAPRLIDEFVLLHNLWRDDENGHYFKLLDDGRTDPVAYFVDGRSKGGRHRPCGPRSGRLLRRRLEVSDRLVECARQHRRNRVEGRRASCGNPIERS